MTKIMVFLAEGFEEVEALTLVDVARRADFTVDMVSVSGENTVTGSHGIIVTADKSINEVDSSSYDCCVLPGGAPGYKNLASSKEVEKIAKDMDAQGKLVAAICAAPTVLGGFGLLKGKKACCYPGMEEGLVGANVSQDPVCVDGHIITSRGVGTAIEFSLTIVEYFSDFESSLALGKKFVWDRNDL